MPLVDDGRRVRRAVAGDGVTQALLSFVPDDSSDAAAGSGFRVERWDSEPATGERAVTVDRTNESVVVGERAVVKWSLRQPPVGTAVRHPARDRLAALAAASFTGTPRPWAALTFVSGDGDDPAPLLLATVTQYLPDALDGWDWAVGDVRALARGAIDLDTALAPASALGDLVARMHAVLAASGREALGRADAVARAARAAADLDEALRTVDGPRGPGSPPVRRRSPPGSP